MKTQILLALFAALLSIANAFYLNPVINADHPDPGVLLLEDGSYAAVTTSNNADNAFPILHSQDLVHWESKGYVFPQGSWPTWAYKDMWAPEIHRVNGNYLIYFTGRDRDTDLLSIGVAVASDSSDPFSSYRDFGRPFIQNHTMPGLGVIDVHYFEDTQDANRPYLVWKTDGNAIGVPSVIYLRELHQDGLSFASDEPTIELISSDREFEHGIVEGAWLINEKGFYFLFYSGDGFASVGYDVSVARSRNVRGPYEKFGKAILGTDFERFSSGENSTFVGPGHCSVVRGNDSNWWMVYHSWRWH